MTVRHCVRFLAPAFLATIWSISVGVHPHCALPTDEPSSRSDYLGDPLPTGAVHRLGTERLRHPEPVQSLRFTPDGKAVASVGFYQDEPLLWDVLTGKRTTRPDAPAHFLSHAAASPDGRRFAVLKEEGKQVEVRETATNKLLFKQSNEKGWDALAFSSDGGSLLALGGDHQVFAWAVPGGEMKSQRKYALNDRPRYAFEEPPAAALTSDGRVLAGVLKDDWQKLSEETRVRFWDPLTGKEGRPSLSLDRGCYRWKWSADGKLLIVFYRDYKIEIWDTLQGKKWQLAENGKLGGDHALVFPDQKIAILATWGAIWARDLESGKEHWSRRIAPPHASGPGLKLSSISAITASPDGKILAAATNCGHVELLDFKTGEPVGFSRQHPGFFSTPGYSVPPHFLPDGKRLLIAHGDSCVLWDVAAGKKLRQFDAYFSAAERLSPDGKLLATYRFVDEQGSVGVLETASGQERWSEKANSGEIVWGGDSETLAIVDRHASAVHFRSAANGKLLRSFRPARPGVAKDQEQPAGEPAAVARDLKQVVVRTTDGSGLQLWDSIADKIIWTWTLPADCHKHSATVHFVPGDRHIAIGMRTRTDIEQHLFILDRATGKLLQSIARWEFLDFSADGRYATIRTAEGNDRDQFQVRDLHTREVVLTVDRVGTRNLNCCISRDGRVLACSLEEGAIEFYDLQTRLRLGPPRKHWPFIHAMAFAPDGKSLAVCYNDSTILLWAVNAAGK